MLVLLSLLTRRLQTAAIFFQRIFCGLHRLFWLLCRILSSRLSGSSLGRAHVEVASCLQTLSQCRACVKSERGKLLAPADSCSFQHRLPKPQIPSQRVFSARMNRLTPHKVWGLITKRRKNQNWLLIELPGWMLMATAEGYFISWEGCIRDWEHVQVEERAGVEQSVTWVYSYIQAVTCPFIP